MWAKISNSRIFYAILALACAVGIWLYVDIVQAPNTTTTRYNIPVEFVGEDVLAEQGLMITSGKDVTVNLTLTGTRTALSKLTRSNISITVQAAYQISEAGEYSLDYSVSFPSSINGKVSVKSSSTSKIDVTVVQMTSATVDIVGTFSGSVVEGALIDESGFLFEIPSVTVSGESSLVEQVDHASVTLAEENLSDTWTGMLDVVLVDAEGEPVDMTNLTSSVESVYTTFPITYVKEVPLTVDFAEGGGATEDNVSVAIGPTDRVTISATQDVLDSIDSILLGTIDLSKVVTSDVLSFSINVPDGVTIISGVTTASVTVTITGLVTRAVETGEVQFLNVPEGLQAESVTQSLVVRIRGDADTMALVLDGDVHLVVDLSELESTDMGVRTMTAKVAVTGFADVGAVGDYQVVVNLTEAPPEEEVPEEEIPEDAEG